MDFLHVIESTATPQRLQLALSKRAKWLFTMLLATLLSTASLPTTALAEAANSYLFGTLEEYSTYSLGEMLTDSYVYTDAWFLEAPEERNDALALASMQLTATTVEGGSGGVGSAFLQGIGFDQLGFARFGSEDPDDCTYTWGTKTIVDGADSYTLVAIAIQSYSFDQATKVKSWSQNFTVNGSSEAETSGEHHAFAKAADTVIDEIAGLAGGGKAKYWIVGQSRGGAIANLIAARLPGVLGASNAGVYAYTFESPATVDSGAIQDAASYGYIHNYRCSDDIVPKVPLWGMTVYGVTHELKTAETDAGLVAELTKLNSKAAEAEVADCGEREDSLVAALEERAPTRADYSKVRTDAFTDANGAAVSVTYSYQDVFVRLMETTFGGAFEGISTSSLMDMADEIKAPAFALVEGVLKERAGDDVAAAPYYWQAAQGLRAFMDEIAASTGTITMSESDVYGLLRLIGPIVVDGGYEPTGKEGEDLLGYLAPLVNIVLNAKSMIYSHHFDTLIARLKVLAPQVPMDDIDILIEDPAAGDAATKAPGEVSAFITSMGEPWLTVESAWVTDDQTLQNDMVYYLEVTLRAVGHVVPEGLQLTINGVGPVGDLDVTYAEGASVIRAMWAFTIGNPADVTITFDTSGHAEAPEPLVVKKGTFLKFVKTPEFVETVTEDGTTWRFDGWRSEDGTVWNDLKAMLDLTVYAKWMLVVDDIHITFPVPKVGDAVVAPTTADDAAYYVESYWLVDSDWNEVKVVTEAGDYNFNVSILLKDPSNSEFALDESGDDVHEYVGSITINDEDVSADAYYQDEDNCISASCDFTVSEESPDEPEAPTYVVTEGDGQVWAKGTDAPVRVTVKRSEKDDETFSHFTGIAVDGKDVDADSYTAEAGSVIVNLKPAYLETLAVGNHALTVRFDDGSAEASFAIEAAKKPEEPSKPDKPDKPILPQTGDEGRGVLCLSLAGLSVTLLLAGVYVRSSFDRKRECE